LEVEESGGSLLLDLVRSSGSFQVSAKKGATTMSKYQIASQRDSDTPRKLAEFLQKEGQFLLPMVELVAQTETAIDELIDVTGRATIEAVLGLSAQEVAGPKHPGKAVGAIGWHGSQEGVVPLSDRKLRVRKPRLRHQDGGEVDVPAYVRLRQQRGLAGRMLKIALGGISTRRYREVLPRMAEAVGVSKSSISRETIEASAQQLQELAERRFDDTDLLVIFIDGLRLGHYHVIAAVGVDFQGEKHVLGIKEGASESTTVVTELLEDLVARGVRPGRRRLFVIDGSKALRHAIDAVYGQDNPVQRCRRHKERNVLGYLSQEEQRRVRRVMKNAWGLPAREGQALLEKEARRLEEEYPSAAGSLREGLDEMFTVSRLGLPPTLARGLCSTNLIESTFSGTRSRTRRVTHWQSGTMALRWAAGALLETEKAYRKVMGYQMLPLLKGLLDEPLHPKVESKQVG
jgi:putative transposase